MKKIIIAAVAENGAIGKDNRLLWHISADMKYFRKTTMGCPVIMGYRTWLSIGRLLPGRKNVVISKSPFEVPDGVVIVSTIEEAFAAVEQAASFARAGEPADSAAAGQVSHLAGPGSTIISGDVPDKCFIIGGAKTYERTMDLADSLYITHVKTTIPDADAYFPEIDPAKWKKISETDPETDPGSGLSYSFAVYDHV